MIDNHYNNIKSSIITVQYHLKHNSLVAGCSSSLVLLDKISTFKTTKTKKKGHSIN